MITKIQSVMVVFLCLLVFSISCEAYSIRFNNEETKLMNTAWKLSLSTEYPEIFQAIMINESVAGRYGRFGDTRFKDWKRRSYGVMQIQFYTAQRMVGDLYTDQELLRLLTTNDDFNILIGAMYFQKLLDMFNGDWKKAALSYNVGPGNVIKHNLNFDPNNYISKIKYHLKNTIYEFNKREDNKDVIIYVVKKGDTLSKIAQNILGDWRKWKEIHKLNSWIIPEKMEIGTELIIRK